MFRLAAVGEGNGMQRLLVDVITSFDGSIQLLEYACHVLPGPPGAGS